MTQDLLPATVQPPMRRSAVIATSMVVAACAHAPRSVSPSDWRPAAGVITVDCNDSEPLPKETDVVALGDLCRADVYAACTALAEQTRLDTQDGPLIRGKLEPRCQADPRCGCAHLGHALLWERSEKDLLRAGDLLDASCHRGALDACDDMALYASLCSVSPSNALCERLKAQNRVPAREEPPGPRALPSSLERCFAILSDVPKLECDASAPTLPAGSVVCVENDRVSTRSPSGRWNQRRARWVGPKDEDFVTDEISGLQLDAKSWSSTTYELGCFEGSLAALPGRWMEDAQRLPRVEAICDRMKRCVAAVARMFPPAHEDDSPPPELPDDLLGCADYQARMTKLIPSPPLECQ